MLGESYLGKVKLMRTLPLFKTAAVLFVAVAGCTVQNPDGTVSVAGTVPPQVAEAAAPNQDLSFVELRDDNCYWYRHRGPVETTMLPLRTPRGRPICVQVAEEATS